MEEEYIKKELVLLYLYKQNNESQIYQQASDSVFLLYWLKNQKLEFLFTNHYDYPVQSINLLFDLIEKNLVYIYDKKTFLKTFSDRIVNQENLIDISSMLISHEQNNIDVSNYLTQTHKRFYNKYSSLSDDTNIIIPSSLHVKYLKNILYDVLNKIKFKINEFTLFYSDITIPAFSKIENSGMKVDKKRTEKYFKDKRFVDKNDFSYPSYNLFASTAGRPSCTNVINYLALNKHKGERSSFISRFGKDGFLLEIDYNASHVILLAELLNYKFKEYPYKEIKDEIYNKYNNDIEISDIKREVFMYMYSDAKNAYPEIDFFNKIEEYKNDLWYVYQTQNYLECPESKRKIKDISNKGKCLNYLMQGIEVDRGILTLKNINRLLEDYQSKVILYVYDSFIFDININDGKKFLNELSLIISNNNRYPITLKIGKDYNNMIKIETEN